MPYNKQLRVFMLFSITTIYSVFGFLLGACLPSPGNSVPLSSLYSPTATDVDVPPTALILTSIPLTPTTQVQISTNTPSVKTIAPIATFGKFDSFINRVVISDDGKIIAAHGGKNHQITVWNVDNGKELLTLENDNDWGFSLSSDGHLLASRTWGDSWITIRDTQTGQKLQKIQAGNSVESLAFSPDGNVLAIGGRSSAIWLWDIENNTLLSYLGPQSSSITALAFSSDGKQLVSVGNYALELWDLNSRKAIKTFKLSKYHMSTGSSWGAGFSPGNPDFLAISYASELDPNSASYGGSLDKNSVEIWDTTNWNIISTITEFAPFGTPMAISPDGRFLVVTVNTETKIWDVSSGEAVYKFQIDWAVFAFNIDGDRLVVGNENGVVELWDISELTN